MSHNKARRGRKPEPPRDVTPSIQPRGNGIGFFAGIAMAVSLIVAANHWDVGSQGQQFACCAFAPLGIALAELRSGYAWSNVGRSSRGVSRMESPRRFWCSVFGHLLMASVPTLIGLLSTFM